MDKKKKRELIKNGYRITKEKDMLALRVRVPGGNLTSAEMNMISEIANKFGRGEVHITIRQGFEIPGIPVSKVEEVNDAIAPILKEWKNRTGVEISSFDRGYPATGTRNIAACIGSEVCVYANFDVANMTYELERLIYPSDYHVKVGFSGCPNDCIKGHTQDIGILGQVEPFYIQENCREKCTLCVDNCHERSKGALKKEGDKVYRDELKCDGCGECVRICPNSACISNGSYFSLLIMGRTGKKAPRLAFPFLSWLSRDNVLKISQNVYSYIDKYIDRSLPKEQLGYIYDRTGFEAFRDEVLKGVDLDEKVVRHYKYK